MTQDMLPVEMHGWLCFFRGGLLAERCVNQRSRSTARGSNYAGSGPQQGGSMHNGFTSAALALQSCGKSAAVRAMALHIAWAPLDQMAWRVRMLGVPGIGPNRCKGHCHTQNPLPLHALRNRLSSAGRNAATGLWSGIRVWKRGPGIGVHLSVAIWPRTPATPSGLAGVGGQILPLRLAPFSGPRKPFI